MCGGSSAWVEWLGPLVGSSGWPSSGWVEWLGRMFGSSGWVEWLAVVKASGNEFVAPAEGGSFSSLSLLLSVYLTFTIFSICSLSCRFVCYRVFEIKLTCGRARYELITFI